MSMASSLPFDILTLIFEECFLLDVAQQSLLLTCRHWHRTVHDSPLLWTRILIDCSHRGRSAFFNLPQTFLVCSSLERLQSLLFKARPRLLELLLILRGPGSAGTDDANPLALSSREDASKYLYLLSCEGVSSRIRSLTIDSSAFNGLASRGENWPRTEFSCLEHLGLCGDAYYLFTWTKLAKRVNRTARNLSSAKFHTEFRRNLLDDRLWAQLQTVDVSELSSSWKALAYCTSVTQLSIQNVHLSRTCNPMTFPTLKHLVIQKINLASLSKFHLPNLRTLSIGVLFSDTYGPPVMAIDLPLLTTLDIGTRVPLLNVLKFSNDVDVTVRVLEQCWSGKVAGTVQYRLHGQDLATVSAEQQLLAVRACKVALNRNSTDNLVQKIREYRKLTHLHVSAPTAALASDLIRTLRVSPRQDGALFTPFPDLQDLHLDVGSSSDTETVNGSDPSGCDTTSEEETVPVLKECLENRKRLTRATSGHQPSSPTMKKISYTWYGSRVKVLHGTV